ncbi:unnamed protein product, partial [Adineta steineri]
GGAINYIDGVFSDCVKVVASENNVNNDKNSCNI